MEYVFIKAYDSKPNDNILVKDKEEKLLEIEYSSNEKRYVCEKCFTDFKSNNVTHLSNCEMYLPPEGIISGSKLPTFTLFKIKDEETFANKRIIKAVEKMGWFSKMEQGIDTSIPKSGMLSYFYFPIPNSNRFYCYVLFSYNNLIGYCWIQVYPDFLGREKTTILRDIYIIPTHRGKNYAVKIIEMMAKDYKTNITNLIFSEPISEKFKPSLRKAGFSKLKVISRENFKSLRLMQI